MELLMMIYEFKKKGKFFSEFYIHGSVHRNSMLIRSNIFDFCVSMHHHIWVFLGPA